MSRLWDEIRRTVATICFGWALRWHVHETLDLSRRLVEIGGRS